MEEEDRYRRDSEDKSEPSIAALVFCMLLVGAGLLGLYHNIEYSGWVLACGLLGAANQL